ncbi:MAG: hypothetical protein DDT22_00840 [candidate division WS2 bacterium]|nr:hypothetical protein [Candidatus Lithacetigena glycinireducens]
MRKMHKKSIFIKGTSFAISVLLCLFFAMTSVVYATDSASFTDSLASYVPRSNILFNGLVRHGELVQKPSCTAPLVPKIFGAMVSDVREFYVGNRFGDNILAGDVGSKITVVDWGPNWQIFPEGRGWGRPEHGGIAWVHVECR